MKFIFIPNIRTFNYLVSDGGYYLFRVIFMTHMLGLISRVIKMNYDLTPELNIRDQLSPIGDTIILILELWVICTPVDEDSCMFNFMTSVETVQKILLLQHHWKFKVWGTFSHKSCHVCLLFTSFLFHWLYLSIKSYIYILCYFQGSPSIESSNSLPFLARCETRDIYLVLKCYMSYI